MNRSQLVDAMAKSSGLSKDQADSALKAFQEVVTETVTTGEEKLTIQGFLTFERVDRAAREGRNPGTGESISIPASTAAKVTVGSALKGAAAGK